MKAFLGFLGVNLQMASGTWVNQELIDFFLAGGPAVQTACLDGLLAIMLDSSTNQKVSVLLFNIQSPYPTGIPAKKLFHKMGLWSNSC